MFPFLKSVLSSTAKGAFVTFGGTAVACAGALVVESQAHRTLYRFFPHWYRDVEYAFGLEPHLLEAVRTPPKGKWCKDDEEPKMNAEWVEQHAMYADRGMPNIFHSAMTA